ncbi:large ribosomal subunit protein mL53 [Patagioenas fasciata]|uniref:Large ribosomal subunit protein mL53 n=1 Tax=Patagioenas fasciata monilis TaxID=372326 RepID=A0A1V4KGJ3_PATFA|nr:39S ribosomal protein L53, mitochondrial [Patagioenas fasciata monilis]
MASKIRVVLRPVKSIVVRFCPFESDVESTRKFLQYINHKKIQATNRNCEVTADVRHDGSEPLVDVRFADGERLIMKGANLTTIEMLTALGARCDAKDIKEEQKSKKKNP